MGCPVCKCFVYCFPYCPKEVAKEDARLNADLKPDDYRRHPQHMYCSEEIQLLWKTNKDLRLELDLCRSALERIASGIPHCASSREIALAALQSGGAEEEKSNG
jgi:hypothetical protein